MKHKKNFPIFLFVIGITFCSLYGVNKKIDYKIAIFKERDFPTRGAPKSLTPKWIYNILSKKYKVVYLDYEELKDKEILSIKNFDLLILPYGQTFPLDAYKTIYEFLKQGGGFFNVAGIPFFEPVKRINGIWQKADIENIYQKFLAPLGIKYYQTSIKPSFIRFNKLYFPNLISKISPKEAVGLLVTTSYGGEIKKPIYGNVFPERIPNRDFIPLASAFDTLDNLIANPIILIKAWQNPYSQSLNIPKKWAFIGMKGEKHPLNPVSEYSKEFLMDIVKLIAEPLVLYHTHTKLASYTQGEEVRFYSKVFNNSKLEQKAILEFNILDESDKEVFKYSKNINVKPYKNILIKASWNPENFKDDFYKIEVLLKKKDKIIDKNGNGFVIKNENILLGGPEIKIKDNSISINDRKSFIYGTNYYESKLGELMWLRPNILNIKRDFEKMHKMGINFVRIHYHHSKWFKDYLREINSKRVNNEFFNVADRTYLPSKRSLRILDAIIQLAKEYELVICLDIFSLVPHQMGNPLGWLGRSERILDNKKIKNQKEFVKILADRYKDIPGITWDLWNEPQLEKDNIEELKSWTQKIINTFREYGDEHPITIGGNVSLKLLDVLDYGSIHTYYPEKFKNLDKKYNKPIIFQEVWNTSGCNLKEGIKQAEKLKNDFMWAKRNGAQGFGPWQWTRQARLWNHMYSSERWDDELGCILHSDGTLKPAGSVYGKLIQKFQTTQYQHTKP